jgi:uncharacterized protein (DUF342 family)
MKETDIYKDEYFRIFTKDKNVLVESYKKGYPVHKLNEILNLNPVIDVKSFNTLKKSVISAPKEAEVFAELVEPITIHLINNDVKALITFNMLQSELELKSRQDLLKKIIPELKKEKIKFGINKELFTQELESGKQYVIAQGIPPVHGKNAIIKMYDIKNPKPIVDKDGNVDHYEMKLINHVQAGDWMGERIEPTPGIPGTSVKEEEIKPIPGKQEPLNYDRTTIQEIYDNTKTVLYARQDGAVTMLGDKISVSNYLNIEGDVDYSTGNIEFDGYVSVKGTVQDGFSVIASKDIEINSPMGVGNVKSIMSTEGRVYIAGGISCKKDVKITAARDIYVKFSENAVLSCEGSLHIGYYCQNSVLVAKEVVLDSTNGRINGGHVLAQYRVIAPEIGSDIEKRTTIEVQGFSREQLLQDMESILKKISEYKLRRETLKNEINILKAKENPSVNEKIQINSHTDSLVEIYEKLKNIELDRKNIAEYLKAKGEGEIKVSKSVKPNVTLIIKSDKIDTFNEIKHTSFYFEDGEIQQSGI